MNNVKSVLFILSFTAIIIAGGGNGSPVTKTSIGGAGVGRQATMALTYGAEANLRSEPTIGHELGHEL